MSFAVSVAWMIPIGARKQAQHTRLGTAWRQLRRRRCREETAVARPLMRDEGGRLPLEAKNASVHIWLVEQHTGVVDEIPSREVVRAVEDHVILSEDLQHVALIEPRLVLHHIHVRVQCCDGNPRRFDLRHANAIRGVDHLALQVRFVDDVGVDNPERTDTGSGEIECRGGTQAARSNQENPCVEELALAFLTNLGDQQVPAVAPALIRGQGLWDTPRQPGRFPSTEATGHRGHVAIAQVAERLGAEDGTDAAGAIDDQGRVMVANSLLDPHLQESARNVHGARNNPLVDLVLFTDVDEDRPLLAKTRRFSGIDFAHAGSLLLQQLLVRWHVLLQVRDILEFLVKFRARRLAAPVGSDIVLWFQMSRPTASRRIHSQNPPLGACSCRWGSNP